MPLLSRQGLPLVILTNIGGVLVDAVLNDELVLSNRITDNPVETGGVVSDHIVTLPTVINMTGRITDTPFTIQRTASKVYYTSIAEFVKSSTITTAGGFLGGSEALAGFNFLANMSLNREAFTVITTLGRFTGMVFESLSVPRVSRDGRSVRFAARMRQLLIAETAAVAAENVAGDVSHTAVTSDNIGIQPQSQF